MEEVNFNTTTTILNCLYTGNNVENYSATVNFTNICNLTNATANKTGLARDLNLIVTVLSLSIFCSALQIFIYWIIGEHKTLPGKITIYISFCFFVAYIFFIMNLYFRGKISLCMCFIIAVICHSFFMASFFWTNVLSYDIMRTIRTVTPNCNAKEQFRKYFIFAWAMTLLCIVTSVAIDLSDSIPAYYKPNFGVRKCWLNGEVAFYMYFNAPVGLSLLVNGVFFILTATTITKVQNSTSILENNRHRERFQLCVKLVLAMGLVWIPEFLYWTHIGWLLTLAEVLFSLHGVYMFVIFACKRRTFKKVKSLWCPSSSSSTPPHTDSSSTVTVATISGSTQL